MRKLTIIAIVTMFAAFYIPALSATADAPTVEQCRTDQELWLSKLEAESIVLIDFRELSDWSREMRQCMGLDQKFEDRYYNTVAEANFAKATRFANFLDRHNLYEQFLTEDAQGKGR